MTNTNEKLGNIISYLEQRIEVREGQELIESMAGSIALARENSVLRELLHFTRIQKEDTPEREDRYVNLINSFAPITLAAAWKDGKDVESKIDRGLIRQEYYELISNYSLPHRHYHIGEHIFERLIEIDRNKDNKLLTPEAFLALEWAWWHHDYYYYPKRDDNEEQSAEKAIIPMIRMGAPQRLIKKIKELVICTKHTTPPNNLEEALIMDIDLITLGENREKYQKYCKNIAREYGDYPKEILIKKRINFLQIMLSSEQIYWTEEYRNRYESIARGNMLSELKYLQSLS